MSIIINLEKEKLRLSTLITRDARTVDDLEKHATLLQTNVLAQQQKLGSYNALFMRMPDADTKAPRQRLGAREAVLGTKRIINRELERLENEVVVSEMKLNRSRERNQGIREKINQLRREHATYRHLFDKMRTELADLKQNTGLVDRAIDTAYTQRDRAFEDMRELAKQFEMDKIERGALFRQVSEDLEALPATTVAESGSASGPRSPSTADPSGGKDALRKRVSKAQGKLAKDKYSIEIAHRKLGVFSSALRKIKEKTGYSSTTEVINVFNRYEEEKFAKAQLAQRLMDEIETLEGSVSSMHTEVRVREDDNLRLKSTRAAQVELLQNTARNYERELEQTSLSVQRTVSDVRSLYRIIEFTFYALGIRSAMDEVNGKPFVAPTSPEAGSSPTGVESFSPASSPKRASLASPASSPKRTSLASPGSPAFGSRQSLVPSPDSAARRTRSLSMYAGDARTRHAVKSGVSSSSLAAFMGTIENKSAEVIQQYAAVMSRLATGELGFNALRSASAFPIEGFDEAEDEDEDGNERDPDVAAAAAGVQARRAVQAFAAESGEMARRFMATPSALGPSNPPGRVKESITASALMASLVVDSARMAGESKEASGGGAQSAAAAATGGGGGAEDDSRLLSVGELKQQALRRLNSDKNIVALKNAATAAANVLLSGGSGGGGGLSSVPILKRPGVGRVGMPNRDYGR